MRFFIVLFLFFLVLPPNVFSQIENDSMIDTIIAQTLDSKSITAETDEVKSDVFAYPMPEERKELLISYSKFNSIWRFVSFFLDLLILSLIVFTGFSSKIRSLAEKISGKRFVHWLIYIAMYTVLSFIIYFPISLYRSFTVEHSYGFANQSFGAWFSEQMTGLGVEILFSIIIITALYWLINRFKRWWLWFAVGMIPFAVVMIIVVPVFISPLFNEFKPLENKELAADLTAMAHKAGIENPDIYQVDGSKQSNKINAYFTGMFGTKRIVLYDTMLDNFTDDEILYVMGHEIGHYTKKHIWKGLFVAIIIIFITAFLADKILPRVIDKYRHKIGFSTLGDIASFPLLILFITIFSFIVQPVQNGISRAYEYDCDEYGLLLSEVSGETAVTAFDKLSVFNLADPSPSDLIEFWFYDHPALTKRMENVKTIYLENNQKNL